MYNLIIGSANTQLEIPIHEGAESAKNWRKTHKERWLSADYVQLEPKDSQGDLKPVRVIIPPGCHPVYYKRILKALNSRDGSSGPIVEVWNIGWEAPGSHRMLVSISRNGYAVSAEPINESDDDGS